MRADAEVAATDEVGTLLSCARAAALALLVRTGSGTFAGATAVLRDVVMGLYARFMDMACRACSFSVYEPLETVVCVLRGCTGGIPAYEEPECAAPPRRDEEEDVGATVRRMTSLP
jgi:hypothetical protein